MGAKNIRGRCEAEGSKIGGCRFAGRGDIDSSFSYLKSKGLIFPRDYSMIVIAGGMLCVPQRACEERRHCAVLGIPFGYIAMDKGFPKLGDTTEVISNYQFNNVNVNPAWSEKNRASVVRFLKAHIQALRWIHDSPSDAVEFMTREFGLQTTYARRGIEYYIKQTKNLILSMAM